MLATVRRPSPVGRVVESRANRKALHCATSSCPAVRSRPDRPSEPPRSTNDSLRPEQPSVRALGSVRHRPVLSKGGCCPTCKQRSGSAKGARCVPRTHYSTVHIGHERGGITHSTNSRAPVRRRDGHGWSSGTSPICVFLFPPNSVSSTVDR